MAAQFEPKQRKAHPVAWQGKCVVAFLVLLGTCMVTWSLRQGPKHPSLAIARELQAPNDLMKGVDSFLEKRKVKPFSEPLSILLSDASFAPKKTHEHALLNRTSPDFELVDSNEKNWRLQDSLDRGPVVLVFYFGYHCNHCVAQLFAIDKDIAHFQELGATVISISADSPELTRERFKKYGPFAFPALSDPKNKVAESFGTYTPAANGKSEDLAHGTFVIDRDSVVRWANIGDEPFTDNRTLFQILAKLEGRLPTTNQNGDR